MNSTSPQPDVLASLDRSDRELITNAMEVLADPPTEPADSFILHAPLELMARAELLAHVEPSARDDARQRVAEIPTEWNARSPHLGKPVGAPTDSLPSSIAAGDLSEADRAVAELATHAEVDHFVALAADHLLAHLGGAGHLSIFLDQIRRFPRSSRSVLSMSRALVGDLARHPDWTLRWVDEPVRVDRRPALSFTDVLASPPSAGDPGSDFIYPTMQLVDVSGLAAELLASPVSKLPLDEARRQLLRIAAMSMLQDDPTNAPYGWSHCLTMPQATLAIAPYTADPRRAVAIAATYVLGFRSTQSNTPIDLDWRPVRHRTVGGVLEGDADDVVAKAWHTDDPDDTNRRLATFAATHHDAHLAKYTLACLRGRRRRSRRRSPLPSCRRPSRSVVEGHRRSHRHRSTRHTTMMTDRAGPRAVSYAARRASSCTWAASQGTARGRTGDLRVDANKRIYSLRPEPLAELDGWLLPYRQRWAARLDALEQFLDDSDHPNRPNRGDRS